MKKVFAPFVFRARAFAGGAMAGAGPPPPVVIDAQLVVLRNPASQSVILRNPFVPTVILRGALPGGLLLETLDGFVLVDAVLALLLNPWRDAEQTVVLHTPEEQTVGI